MREIIIAGLSLLFPLKISGSWTSRGNPFFTISIAERTSSILFFKSRPGSNVINILASSSLVDDIHSLIPPTSDNDSSIGFVITFSILHGDCPGYLITIVIVLTFNSGNNVNGILNRKINDTMTIEETIIITVIFFSSRIINKDFIKICFYC